MARVSGEIYFDNGYRLVIRERLLFHCSPIIIDWYGYEIWSGEELLGRYDCQPHPGDPVLASSYPHHKHILPNLNRNRIPAPNMSFNQPNIRGRKNRREPAPPVPMGIFNYEKYLVRKPKMSIDI